MLLLLWKPCQCLSVPVCPVILKVSLNKKLRCRTQPRKGPNRAGTELWNSHALGQCKMAPPVEREVTQCRVPSIWDLVSQVPCLGTTLGLVAKNIRLSWGQALIKLKMFMTRMPSYAYYIYYILNHCPHSLPCFIVPAPGMKKTPASWLISPQPRCPFNWSTFGHRHQLFDARLQNKRPVWQKSGHTLSTLNGLTPFGRRTFAQMTLDQLSFSLSRYSVHQMTDLGSNHATA